VSSCARVVACGSDRWYEQVQKLLPRQCLARLCHSCNTTDGIVDQLEWLLCGLDAAAITCGSRPHLVAHMPVLHPFTCLVTVTDSVWASRY
jgi:hypothetical protein